MTEAAESAAAIIAPGAAARLRPSLRWLTSGLLRAFGASGASEVSSLLGLQERWTCQHESLSHTIGARLVVSHEFPQGARWHDGTVKIFTGGGDVLKIGGKWR